MNFTLHTDFESLAPLADEWNALLAESVTDAPFLHFEYLRDWWQTLGGGEWTEAALAVVTAHEDGRLLGIAPLFHATNRDGLPALLLLGSIEISDYLDLIVRPSDLPRFLPGLLDFLDSLSPQGDSANLRQHLHLTQVQVSPRISKNIRVNSREFAEESSEPWRGVSTGSTWQLDWYNLPEASPTLAALEAESARRGWDVTREVYQPAPFISLPADFDAYLAGIDKKQRHEIRRKLRRAAEYELPVRWYLVEDEAMLESEMEAFFALMIQDPAKENFLTAPMKRQMLATARTAMSKGWLWLAFLEVGGKKAAAEFNFDYGNRLWGYNSGVARDFIELSPGWVLLAYALQWACEHGRTEFDFMRGNEEYKYRFGGKERRVMRVRVVR